VFAELLVFSSMPSTALFWILVLGNMLPKTMTNKTGIALVTILYVLYIIAAVVLPYTLGRYKPAKGYMEMHNHGTSMRHGLFNPNFVKQYFRKL